VQTLVVQADGQIILGGDFSSVNGTARNFLARLTAIGALDPSFKPGGTLANATVSSFALQANGRVLCGGLFTTFDGSPRSLLARLNNGAASETLVPYDIAPWSGSAAGPRPISPRSLSLTAPMAAVPLFPLSELDPASVRAPTGSFLTLACPLLAYSAPARAPPLGLGTGGSGLIESTAPFTGLLTPALAALPPHPAPWRAPFSVTNIGEGEGEGVNLFFGGSVYYALPYPRSAAGPAAFLNFSPSPTKRTTFFDTSPSEPPSNFAHEKIIRISAV
jgi:Domain of unknown function (DUF5122) beta-propeller